MRYAIALFAVVLLFACGSGSNSPEATGSGQIGLSVAVPAGPAQSNTPGAIMLPNGASISSLSYTLDDGQGHTYSAAVDVSQFHGATAHFVIPNVFPDTGYTVTITSQTDDGNQNCNGASSAFEVKAKGVTPVSVNIVCVQKAGGNRGAVNVNGTYIECPIWNWATSLTDPVAVGTSTTLYVGESSDNPATFTWSLVSGSGLLDGTSVSAEYDPQGNIEGYTGTENIQCPASPETETVQFVVDVPADNTNGCPAAYTTGTIQVHCQ